MTAVEPRKRPQQDRSKDMVERILMSTQTVIRDTGVNGLNTVAVAREAGISVGSLYQYFPSKEAILLELARRWLAAFRSLLKERTQCPLPRDWRDFDGWCRTSIQKISAIYLKNVGVLPVVAAMPFNAQLRKISTEHDVAIIEEFANWFQRINPALDRAVARRLSWNLMVTDRACLTRAATSGRRHCKETLEDLNNMLLALMRPHLDLV